MNCLVLTPPDPGPHRENIRNLWFTDRDMALAAETAIKHVRPEYSLVLLPPIEICESVSAALATVEFWNPKVPFGDEPMTLEQFRSTRKEGDVSELYGYLGNEGDPIMGYEYAIGSSIAKDSKGGFHLVIANADWLDDDCAKLESILWATHYLSDTAPDMPLSNEGDDTTLDDFVCGICHAMNVEVDGDLLGVMFSDSRKTHWTQSEVETILHGPYRALLKAYAEANLADTGKAS